jgi:hypothetical protein
MRLISKEHNEEGKSLKGNGKKGRGLDLMTMFESWMISETIPQTRAHRPPHHKQAKRNGHF